MKRFVTFLLCAAMLFSLAACGKKKPTPPVEPEKPAPTEPTVPETPAEPEVKALDVRPFQLKDDFFSPVGKDENALLMHLDISFPRIKDMPKVTKYYEDMQDDLVAVYDQEREMADIARTEAENRGEIFEPYQFTAEYTVLRNDGKTLSVLRTVTEQRGEEVKVLRYGETFGVASQGRLLLSDLFSGKEDEFLPALMEKLAALIARSETEFYTDDPAMLRQSFDAENFALKDDALVLFFGDHRISDEACVFELPLSELSALLRAPWVK